MPPSPPAHTLPPSLLPFPLSSPAAAVDTRGTCALGSCCLQHSSASQQPSQVAASAWGGCHAHPSSLPAGFAVSALTPHQPWSWDLSLPFHPAEFQEVGFGSSQKHLRMELTGGAQGPPHCRTWVTSLLWVAAPREPAMSLGKNRQRWRWDWDALGWCAEGADGHPAALGRRVMPAWPMGGGWPGEQDPCRRGTGNDTSWPEPHPRVLGEGHAPLTWAHLGGFSLGSALLSRPRGLFPHGGGNLAGGCKRGRLELGSPAPGVGCTFPAAMHHAPCFATPAPSPAFIPPRLTSTASVHGAAAPSQHPASPPAPHCGDAQHIGCTQLLPAKPCPPQHGQDPKPVGPRCQQPALGMGPPPGRAEQSQLLCSHASRMLALYFRYRGPDAGVGVNPSSAGAGLRSLLCSHGLSALLP